jgi:hypothetical protein
MNDFYVRSDIASSNTNDEYIFNITLDSDIIGNNVAINKNDSDKIGNNKILKNKKKIKIILTILTSIIGVVSTYYDVKYMADINIAICIVAELLIILFVMTSYVMICNM